MMMRWMMGASKVPDMRRVVTTGFIAIVIGAVFLVARQSLGGQDKPAESQIQTTIAERGDVLVSVRATGRVDAARTAQVTFDSAGIVQSVSVEEGQTVAAGQELARLDGEVQRIAVEQAELAVRIAELSLLRLEQPAREGDLAAARAAVNSAWTAYVNLRDNAVDPESVRIAELQYQQAQASYEAAEQASRDARRSDMSLAQVGAASFAAEIARMQLQMAQEGVPREALHAAQGQVARAQAQVRLLEEGPAQYQFDQAALVVEQARLQLERAQAAYEDTVLRAPFTGVVGQVNVRAGSLVAPGALPAMAVVDFSALSVIVKVDEVDVVQVTQGQAVDLTLDALPGQVFHGIVSRIADAASQSDGVVVYEVRIGLDGSTSGIRPGMTAAATIIVENVQDVLVVPNLYIRLDRRTGQAFVNVLLPDGSLEERPVELGAQNETVSEVRSGIQEGDVIALDTSGGVFSFFERSE